jgi:hypothetical protein
VRDQRDGDSFLQTNATVAAACSIDLNHAFEAIVGKLGASYTRHSACDFQHVTRLRTQALQVGWREPCNGVAHVFDARLRNS